MNQNVMCYKCNNLRHKEHDSRLENPPNIKTEKSSYEMGKKKEGTFQLSIDR